MNKGKLIEEHWKENKLNSLINDCLSIEHNIDNMNKINESIKKNNNMNILIQFYPEEKGINQLLETIKNFGNIESENNRFDSTIEFDQALVRSWLNNKNFSSKLLFRKSRDGSTPKDFHDKCNNKGITIIFIETTKGYKFGGYTELNWDNNSGEKKINQLSYFLLIIEKNTLKEIIIILLPAFLRRVQDLDAIIQKYILIIL